MTPEQGDIVLIPIPFTDLSSRKRRPVIIVSNNTYNHLTDDIVVVAMTSNPQKVDYSFTINVADLDRGNLNRSGQVRADKIYTLSKSIVVKKFGHVKPKVLTRISSLLKDLMSQKST